MYCSCVELRLRVSSRENCGCLRDMSGLEYRQYRRRRGVRREPQVMSDKPGVKTISGKQRIQGRKHKTFSSDEGKKTKVLIVRVVASYGEKNNKCEILGSDH